MRGDDGVACVTQEQIERAREVDALGYILANEPGNVRRVGNCYRLKDHPSLSIDGNGWFWHSRGIGGKAIDYLVSVRGYKFVDAVCALIHEKPTERHSVQKTKPPATATTSESKPPTPTGRKPFAPPPRNTNNLRVIAYLQSRGIEKTSIQACIENGSLYESARYHNCVFVGRDENGMARFAALRGTSSSFKCDANGSDKRFGFVLPPGNPNSGTVAVFESAIDCLSHQSMCIQGFIEPFDGWRLSLGGTALAALAKFLERHAGVTNCQICTDDDEAGWQAAKKIEKLPGITATRALANGGNDWNEALLKLQKTERLQNRKPCGIERG